MVFGAALNHMMECAARIKPGFLPQSIIFPSQAAECLRCQVAPRSGELTLAPVQDADARPRGLHPGQFAAECLRCQFAPMAARCARAHREDSARARGLHPWQVAPRAARSARAHREDSTRSRRGMVLNSLRLVFSHLSGGVWRRPAPRPLRKISPPNGGARGLLFFAAFCGVTCGD